MATRIPIVPQVIRWARERNNLTVAEAAKRLQCTSDILEQVETGELRPTATLFRRMASVYLLPEATLLGAAVPQDRALPKDFRSFDGAPVEVSYETICAIRRVESRQDSLAQLADIDPAVLAPNLPIYSLNDDPERLGANFRRKLGFPVVDQLRVTREKAFTLWRMLVENMGVSVYVEPLGEDDTRGVSVFSNDFPAIVIDQNEKLYGARLFTLFHELAHLLVRQAGISDCNNKNSVEAFCNKFASAFLMPIEAVEAVFSPGMLSGAGPTIPQLDYAAGRLCVTIAQVALRLEQLGKVRGGFYRRVVSTLKPPTPKRKTGGSPPYKYVYLSEAGSHLPATIFDSLERQQITKLQASRILDLAPAHFKSVQDAIEQRRAELVNADE